jgi:NCAIR mutase (PurE)-related protein
VRRDRAEQLLRDVAAGSISPEAALAGLTAEPLAHLPFATVDHHRALRQGDPEVVFAHGKTPGQCVAVATELARHGDGFLVTRADEPTRFALGAAFPEASVNELGRTVRLAPSTPVVPVSGTALLVTAGTSDLPVAEEAAETALASGVTLERLTDVGVAGIHRVLSRHDLLSAADVVIVVAGMDGALPSVVAGLVRAPVIAVPTSVGYGASFGGLAALLAMLNSCAAGVTVVNIDNGYGAATAAIRTLRASRHPSA